MVSGRTPYAENIVGQHFNRLVVLRRVGYKWLCECKCGGEIAVATTNLKTGAVKSCGCWRREKIGAFNRTHGLTGTTEYIRWRSMIERCTNPAHKNFCDYGGRGIKICGRWMKFENFITDMGKCPAGLTLERIDNDRGYEPSNCRWATRQAQAANRRSNRIFTLASGETISFTALRRRLGLTPMALQYHIDRLGDIDAAILFLKTYDRAKVLHKPHCPQGHAYDRANTRVQNGARYCRACERDRARRRSAAKKLSA